MTRQSRQPAPSLLHAAEEALSGPRRCVAGSVPGWALPHCGTMRWHWSHHPGANARLACVGFGARAASMVTAAAFVQRSRATHQWTGAIPKTDGLGPPLGPPLRHSAIAICIAHVLNSSRAPIASLTSKLTRHERGPNRGPNGRRVCTETRCRTSDGRQRASASGVCRHGQWQIFSAAGCITVATRLAARGPRAQWGTSLAGGRRSPHRAELCRLTPSRGAPLS